jgi:pyrroloquinoline quinone biosynthesis protein D
MSAEQQGLGESTVPRLGRGVRLKHDEVRDSWMLLAPERMFELDAIAVEIIKRVDGVRNLGEIADDLAATFNAERGRVLADVREFVGELAAKRAIDT